MSKISHRRRLNSECNVHPITTCLHTRFTRRANRRRNGVKSKIPARRFRFFRSQQLIGLQCVSRRPAKRRATTTTTTTVANVDTVSREYRTYRVLRPLGHLLKAYNNSRRATDHVTWAIYILLLINSAPSARGIEYYARDDINRASPALACVNRHSRHRRRRATRQIPVFRRSWSGSVARGWCVQ